MDRYHDSTGRVVALNEAGKKHLIRLNRQRRIGEVVAHLRRNSTAYALATLAVTSAIAFVHTSKREPTNSERGCGFAIVRSGEGPGSVIDRAMADAKHNGVDDQMSGRTSAIEQLPELYPNQRFALTFRGGQIVDVQEITNPGVNSCADIAATNQPR